MMRMKGNDNEEFNNTVAFILYMNSLRAQGYFVVIRHRFLHSFELHCRSYTPLQPYRLRLLLASQSLRRRPHSLPEYYPLPHPSTPVPASSAGRAASIEIIA